MTVTDVPVRNTVSDTGFTGVLSLPNVLVEDETHVKVYAGVTELSLGSDYSVTGVLDPNGPVVTILDPSAHRPTTDWTIRFAPPLDQAADLSLGGSFGLAYENAIDALARRFQSVAERLNRSLTLAVNYTGQPLSLPPGDPGKSFKWNETGDGLVNTVSDPDSYVADALAAAAEAKGYRNTTKTYRDEVVALADEIDTIAGIAPELLALYAIRTDISTVAVISGDVATVGQNIASVLTVAANTAKVSTVADDLTGPNTVGAVAGIAGAVVNVDAISADVQTVAANTGDVTTVAAISTDVATLAPLSSQIQSLAAISSDVSAAVANSADISTVSSISSDVSAVAGIATNVTAVAGNETNINAVVGNAANINAAVANEANINAAPQAALDAASARDLSERWANEAEDVPVEGGEFSAYHWSKKAEQSAAGSSDNISNQSDVPGATVTDALNTLAAAGIPGQISAFAFNTAPDGWLKANGAAVSRTTYSDLFGAIGTTFGAGDGSTTFNVPDLRGEFLRGWDDGRGVDTGRAFGSTQQDQNKSHTHTGTAASAGAHGHSASSNSTGAHTHSVPAVSGESGGGSLIERSKNGSRIDQATSSAGAHSHTITVNSGGDHTHTLSIDADGGTEARPRNVALLACIKY